MKLWQEGRAMLRAVGDVLIVASAVQSLEWTVAYHRLTRGTWRATRIGWHVMCFQSAISAVLLLSMVRVAIVDVAHRADPAWFQALRLGVFVAIPAVIGWRRVLLAEAQDDDDPADFYGESREESDRC